MPARRIELVDKTAENLIARIDQPADLARGDRQWHIAALKRKIGNLQAVNIQIGDRHRSDFAFVDQVLTAVV